MSRTREISTIAATWVGIISALYGGHAAYNQYSKSVAKQLDDRATMAINFVTQFQSAHMMALREKIYGVIFCGNACETKTVSNSEFFAFVEFFDAVNYCAERNLCDREIIKDVFGSYATWHWPCLARDIKAVRRGEEQFGLSRAYGHGLETLKIKDVGTAHCGNLARAGAASP